MKPVLLHAGNPGPMTGSGNWTYLIGRRRPVLIDAGVGNDRHLDALAAESGGPVHIVVTHAHSDHISGANAILDRWPSAQLSKLPWPARDPELPWTPLADGSIVSTDEGELEVVHTPGHAPDHVTLWHAESRTLFVGDMLVAGSTVVIPASHGGSLAEYLRSLDRLRALDPLRAYPAHGPVIEDPIALIDHYQRHRAQRELQVVGAMASGHDSVSAIAAALYPSLADALVPMARESVLAHLEKLESEGRAERREERWSLR